MTPAIFYKRKFWLGLALLIVISVAALPEHKPLPATQESSRPSLIPNHSNATAMKANIAFAPLLETSSPVKATAIVVLFPQQSWLSPPPPRVASSIVQPAAIVPAMPFTFAGRYTEGNKITLFLMEGSTMHRVQLGDIVNEKYRIEKIEQAAISITYLPLNKTELLPTGVLLP